MPALLTRINSNTSGSLRWSYIHEGYVPLDEIVGEADAQSFNDYEGFKALFSNNPTFQAYLAKQANVVQLGFFNDIREILFQEMAPVPLAMRRRLLLIMSRKICSKQPGRVRLGLF